MSEELKPCPFCGGKAVLLGGPQAQECHSVWCLECSAKMQGGMQAEPLVEKWNARPAPAVQVPDELISDLRGMAEFVGSPLGGGRGRWKRHALAAADMLAAAPTHATVATEAVAQDDHSEHPLDMVAQGGGVDVEKVMALVEQYGQEKWSQGDNQYRRGCESSATYYSEEAGRIRDRIRALLASAPAAPVGDGLAFGDAVRIARGCTDYGGGYRHEAHLFEAYQSGIKTVIRSLEAAEKKGLADSQVRALHCMGSPAPAATKKG